MGNAEFGLRIEKANALRLIFQFHNPQSQIRNKRIFL